MIQWRFSDLLFDLFTVFSEGVARPYVSTVRYQYDSESANAGRCGNVMNYELDWVAVFGKMEREYKAFAS